MKQIDLLPVKVYPEGTDIEALYKEKQAELILLSGKLADVKQPPFPDGYWSEVAVWQKLLLEVYSLKISIELMTPIVGTCEY